MSADTGKKDKIISFLQHQIASTEDVMHPYVFDHNEKPYPTRDIFHRLHRYGTAFITNRTEPRWIMLTGLRGVGKTTLLAQLYHAYRGYHAYKLSLSVDYVTEILGVPLDEVLATYEELIGKRIEKLDKPLFLFLDEIQYEKKWGVLLKTLYDRSKKIFIICTGSSALHLQSNADVARRAVFEKIWPLSFTEYIHIQHAKPRPNAIADEIRDILFASKTAEDVYRRMKKIEPKINAYWLGIDNLEIDKFIRYGSLPFMLSLTEESLMYEQIRKNIERIIEVDIPYAKRFSRDIISRIPSIVYAVSDTDIVNVSKFSERYGISRPNVIQIFNVLEKTEILMRVYPYGSHFSQTNKPSKYLFTSPACRAMYYHFIGSIKSREDAMGKLLEDTVALSLVRSMSLHAPHTALTYDYENGGADFIVTAAQRNILIEVGMGTKGFKQILQTAKKVPSAYGLVISRGSLMLSNNGNAVRIPVQYFLLV